MVWPESAEGIAKTLRYGTRNSVPVAPYGGGTGVMGAAMAAESAVVLNMGRMNRVVEVDMESRTGAFQPGIVLEDAHRALVSRGLRLGHDPWSRPIATVGGAISTNGVGYTASGHGAMGDQVLGMKVVSGRWRDCRDSRRAGSVLRGVAEPPVHRNGRRFRSYRGGLRSELPPYPYSEG